MIPYYGLPITPATAAVEAVAGGHAFVSFAHQQQLGLAMDVCQSFALDNGAFSAWTKGSPVKDWSKFYQWVDILKRHPGFDFAVIPDVIDGSEQDNDELIAEWPHGRHVGAPVWHMHEGYSRLQRLCREWPRVCIGSSGDYATVGTKKWWGRMENALDCVCDRDGYPRAKLHGLRMLNPKIFQKIPFSSADSTNIARNVGMDDKWKKSIYPPPTKEARARLMRARTEHYNGAQKWEFTI